MKTRIVKTEFHRSMVIMKAPKDVRHLFLHLITNEYISLSGMFELADEYIVMETGLSTDELAAAKQWLEDHKKIFFHNSWIYVVNAEKHNNYRKSPKTEAAYEKELKSIPAPVRDYFKKISDTTIDTTIDSSPNTENIKHNPKSLNQDLGSSIKDEGLLKGEEKDPGTPAKNVTVKKGLEIIDRLRKMNKTTGEAGFIQVRLFLVAFILTLIPLLLMPIGTNRAKAYADEERVQVTPTIAPSATPTPTPTPTPVIEIPVLLHKIHGLESTWGRAPSGYHIVCRNKGLWNEYGYGVSLGICFRDKDHADQVIGDWYRARFNNGMGLSTALCYYNTGYKLNDCDYYRSFLSIK